MIDFVYMEGFKPYKGSVSNSFFTHTQKNTKLVSNPIRVVYQIVNSEFIMRRENSFKPYKGSVSNPLDTVERYRCEGFKPYKGSVSNLGWGGVDISF